MGPVQSQEWILCPDPHEAPKVSSKAEAGVGRALKTHLATATQRYTSSALTLWRGRLGLARLSQPATRGDPHKLTFSSPGLASSLVHEPSQTKREPRDSAPGIWGRSLGLPAGVGGAGLGHPFLGDLRLASDHSFPAFINLEPQAA